MPDFPLLSMIVFLPLVGCLFILLARHRPQLCRWLALSVSLSDLGLVASLLMFDLQWHSGATGRWLLVEDFTWIPYFGIRYSLGLDGISLVLILLTAFLTVLCVLISWREIDSRVGAFHFALLAMETGILGVFLATDLFLFYVFWEGQLLPMFFLVGIWGHEERIRATYKFLLFTIAGSLFMLLALIGIYVIHGSQTGTFTFSLSQLLDTTLSHPMQRWLYAAFLLSFAIKIPIIPLHTWLPDVHTQASTAGSVILAGLLLKTGVYALIRFAFPLFPAAAEGSMTLLLVLGLAGLFYAAWIAFAQDDMKRLVAYSSIAHMGLVLVGVAIWNLMTLSGAVLQMINHGLTTSALFIMVGILDERAHSRKLTDFGGLWTRMPVYSGFLLFFALASMGLPGLNNFVGEILILVGTFKKNLVVGVIGLAGLVFTVAYILKLVQESLFGEARSDHIRGGMVSDLTIREAFILVPLAVAVLAIGFHPGPILKLFQDSVKNWMDVSKLLL